MRCGKAPIPYSLGVHVFPAREKIVFPLLSLVNVPSKYKHEVHSVFCSRVFRTLGNVAIGTWYGGETL